jgi:hypothetical protein
MAGQDWYKSFMKRNPTLSVQEGEGILLICTQGLNKKEADAYFDMLSQLMMVSCLLNKPGSIYITWMTQVCS